MALAALLAAGAVLLPVPVLRVPAGLGLVLALPGLGAVGPLRPRLSTMERVALVPLLSIAVPVLGGIGFYAAGARLTAPVWAVLTTVVTLAGCGTHLALVARAPRTVGAQRPAGPVPARRRPGDADGDGPRPAAQRVLRAVVPAVLTIALLGGAGAVALRAARAGSVQHYTALSITPVGSAEALDRSVRITVSCNESGPTGYTLRVTGADGYATRRSARLAPGDSRTWQLSVPGAGRITAQLYTGDRHTPYRSVFLAGG
ncbi:hypothetical protein Athai_49020 [Actinocatenispora thailandica]|uniref:DUF1616 domain-containing protein n=1 Tax=Actinocatenispora thailandica TaxID=227318 RepID=A0A7R7HZJ1_9ACTN|nr:hypothetical protein Athai_49020 [Actinocatenispora thailandica]